MESDAATSVVPATAIGSGVMALDIGPLTVEQFGAEIAKAGTIVWNGPMGVFEIPAFSRGTMEIAKFVADASGFSVVGGGDTVRAVHQAGIEDKISYISTGGGAFMEFMEGKTLPESRPWSRKIARIRARVSRSTVKKGSFMSQRKPIIAGNWKLHKTPSETRKLVRQLAGSLAAQTPQCEVIVAPAFPSIPAAVEETAGTPIQVSAQNLYWEDSGAFTGEVSGPMLKEAGCACVLIGHSERRQYFGETDNTVNMKIKAAQRSDLIPIFCLGETLAEREAGKTFEVVKTQLIGGLDSIAGSDPQN